MKVGQVSFAAGEISPLLHARVDLAKYRTGLAELVNMIVLPQGGVTRRAGLQRIGLTLGVGEVRLIPFEYNTTDSVMLEFGANNLRIWCKTSSGYSPVGSVITTPYSVSEAKDLRYVQSGNVMFLTHRNHKPMMLRRNSLTSWTLEELPFRNGPFISGEEWSSGTKLKLEGAGRTRTVKSDGKNVFSSGLVGTLLQVEYAVESKMFSLESALSPDKAISQIFEVKGTMNITTAGDWQGVVTVDRSADGGVTWITVRQYVRRDTASQGQWDFTLSETEDGVLYMVTAQHITVETEAEPKYTVTSTSFSTSAYSPTYATAYAASQSSDDNWVYNSDKTTRRSTDGSTLQWHVLRNGEYVWQTITPDYLAGEYGWTPPSS